MEVNYCSKQGVVCRTNSAPILLAQTLLTMKPCICNQNIMSTLPNS